jgi:hypothetical protein
VPFLKFSRDRRGYEHYCLVEPLAGRREKRRERVLYWFRTPPNVKVGREPFDDHVMRVLEAQYPGIVFDWEALRSTPIPSVEPEYWRERRRAERAARRAQEEEVAEESPEKPGAEEPIPESPAADVPHDRVAETVIGDPDSSPAADDVVSTQGAESGLRTPAGLRRRRRRRGRGPAVLPVSSSGSRDDV